MPARVQILVPPRATSRPLYELLGRVRLEFLAISPFRIACVFLHVERGRSSKRVWRSPRIIYCLYFTLLPPNPTQCPVPASVCLCGAPSSTATLPCTLVSPLLPSLTTRSSLWWQTLSPDRSAPPTLSQTLNQSSANEILYMCEYSSHHARLLSLQCRHARAYLDTVPVNERLCLTDGDFINSCLHPHATGTGSHVPTTAQCCTKENLVTGQSAVLV
jgi:hypothetical protein